MPKFSDYVETLINFELPESMQNKLVFLNLGLDNYDDYTIIRHNEDSYTVELNSVPFNILLKTKRDHRDSWVVTYIVVETTGTEHEVTNKENALTIISTIISSNPTKRDRGTPHTTGKL